MLSSTSRVFIAFLLTAATALTTLGGDAHAADPRVVYGGRLQDAQGRPIGGVYPLTFNFYRTEKGGRASWSESHFVAVDNGIYAVELGSKKPLPKNIDLDKVWLGVTVTGGAEVLREKFVAPAVTTEPAAPATPGTPGTPTPAPTAVVGVAPAKSSQSYAELAGFAYEAERAKTADAIGGMTAQEIKNLAKATTAPTKPKLGTAKRFSEQAGGSGGTPYTLQCPPGYVVTGVKGGAAAYMDSLVLICSPFE